MKNGEILSVGTELLLGQIVDTHAPTMAKILAECGIACTHRQTVGDNLNRLADSLQLALSRSDLVITIGGLGPTQDDLTREAIALALDDRLESSPEMETKLQEFFESRQLKMVASNLRQAQKPTCARFLENPNGTAPGLWCEKNGKVVIALPGPKGEFVPMATGQVREELGRLQPGRVIASRIVRIIGLGESFVEAQIADLMQSNEPSVAPYAHTGEVHLRVTAAASSMEQAQATISPVVQEISRRLGAAVYGFDSEDLEQATLRLAEQAGETVSVAESLTGGGLGERLTGVVGASSSFFGGVITYTVDAKKTLLTLSNDDLSDGPVSEKTAIAMAESIRKKLATTYGVALTGNAGPSPDVDQKPVGLVFVAIAGPSKSMVDKSHFRGTREDIRRRAQQMALNCLRNEILTAHPNLRIEHEF
jgi:nicotinamide-nucleotide amidase